VGNWSCAIQFSLNIHGFAFQVGYSPQRRSISIVSWRNIPILGSINANKYSHLSRGQIKYMKAKQHYLR
jgi:hypothetical protein